MRSQCPLQGLGVRGPGVWGWGRRGLEASEGEAASVCPFCLFSWIKFPSRFCLSIFCRLCYSLTHHVPDQPLAPTAFLTQVASADGCFVLRPQFTSLWRGSLTASLSPCAPVATPWAPVVGGAYRHGHLQGVRLSGKGGLGLAGLAGDTKDCDQWLVSRNLTMVGTESQRPEMVTALQVAELQRLKGPVWISGPG